MPRSDHWEEDDTWESGDWDDLLVRKWTVKCQELARGCQAGITAPGSSCLLARAGAGELSALWRGQEARPGCAVLAALSNLWRFPPSLLLPPPPAPEPAQLRPGRRIRVTNIRDGWILYLTSCQMRHCEQESLIQLQNGSYNFKKFIDDLTILQWWPLSLVVVVWCLL